jgi:hypothetical protein
MTPDEADAIVRSLAQTMEHQRTINDDLRAMMANHEGRLRYAEETLRQVNTTQQAIKDILERLNGR